MSSLLQERLGVQEPQVRHVPPDVVSLAGAEEAIALADAYGVCDGWPLAESQRITLRGALGERADGSWAASRVANFGPRQGTGKNDVIAARELAGLLVFKERLIIHTAHELATAKESFRRFEAIFENWDELRKKVARFRYSNEEHGLELLTGQRLIYKARSGKGSRGFAKADLLVYDEAQHLVRDAVAASGPARLANPNSQTWYAGSGGLGTSKLAWAIRRTALGGDGGRLAYTEHTAEKVWLENGRVRSERPDPLDRDAWYRAMPGLGRWVTEEAMADQLEELGPELFARECLCVWDLELGGPDKGFIPDATWALVNRPTVEPVGAVVFGVGVHLERSTAAIAGVGTWYDPDDKVEASAVELIEHRAMVGWLVARCVELNDRWDGAVFAVDGSAQAPVASFVPALRAVGLNVVEVTSDWPAACGEAYDGVVERTIRVRRHSSLDAAVAGADRKWSGDSWKWDRRGETDICPLEAVTAALWVAGHRDAIPDVGGDVDEDEFEAELARIEEDEARALAALGEDDDL